MNTLFTSNRLLPGLKRRSRPTNKLDATSGPMKAKPLDILPDLSEEDEGRHSCSSATSSDFTGPYRGSQTITLGTRLCSKDLAQRKRDSRRVVLTGAENLTFEDFFPMSSAPSRPAPAPPLYKVEASCDSPLDDINLRFSGLGIELDFPSPPSEQLSTPIRRRGKSPTPSISSSVTSSTTSSSSSSGSKKVHVTPPTSDDESLPHLLRAPTCKSHRASIMFMKSMPDLAASAGAETCEGGDSDVDSDAEWFAQDISDVVTLSSPLPPSFPQSAASPSSGLDARARPDSIMLPPCRAGRSRLSKPLPTVPRVSMQAPAANGRPSAQLDPRFPSRRKSFLIPDRPPPPPPIEVTRCSTATMERETEELLAQLASAALSSGFLGTGLSPPHDRFTPTCSAPPTPSSAFVVTLPSRARPPPRMSVPADISDLSDEAPYTPGATAELEVVITPEVESECGATQAWPSSPLSTSIYSQASTSIDSLPVSPASAFSFDMDVTLVDGSSQGHADVQGIPERTLRSRWSSSTLGSQLERDSTSASWIARFNLSPAKKGKGKGVPTPSSPTKRASPPRSPISPALKRSFEFERLERRDSTSSRMSDARSDSGDSTASSGLRRKPIPVEMFIRA